MLTPACPKRWLPWVVACCAAPVGAATVAWQPRLNAGVQDYALRFDDAVSPTAAGGHDFRDGFKIQDQLAFAGAGINVGAGRWFADLSGQWTQRGSDRTEQFEGVSIGGGVVTAGDGQNHRSDVDFDRQEYNLSLGWAAADNFSVYVGYKHARAGLVQTLTPILTPPPYVDLTGGRDGDVLFTGDYHMKFTYDGPFIGATFAVPVGNRGAIALQSSLARLDGSFAEEFSGTVAVTSAAAPGQRRLINPTFKDGSVDGRSVGINVGLSWTGYLGAGAGVTGWSYTVGIDHSQYKFDAGRSPALWASDFEETVTRARLEVRYRFAATVR
jgi:hypothetical protein